MKKYLTAFACAAALLAMPGPADSAGSNLRAEMVVRPSGRLAVACDSIVNMRKLVDHALSGETTLYMGMQPRYCGGLPTGQYRILSVRETGYVQFESMSKKPYRYSWAAQEAFSPE